MTIAAEHSYTRDERRHRAAPRVRFYHPLGVASLGFLTAILGAWAGIAAFVGPQFHYPVTSQKSWDWTAANALLHLWPGVVALVAGLIFMLFVDARSRVSRSIIRLSALAAIAAGTWLVIGPALWPVFETSPAYVTQNTASMDFWMKLGSSLGPGLLVVAISALVFEAIAGRVPVVEEEAAPATATAAPATANRPEADARNLAADSPHPTEPAGHMNRTGTGPATGTDSRGNQLP